jgi:uncharacterized membrane protein
MNLSLRVRTVADIIRAGIKAWPLRRGRKLGRPADFSPSMPLVCGIELNNMYDIKSDPDRPQPRRHVDWFMVAGMISGLLIGGLIGASLGGEVGFIVGDIVGGVLGALVGLFVEKVSVNRVHR